MKIDVCVTAMIEMEHMIIDVPDHATQTDIISAVLDKINNGGFTPDDLPELRYIEDNEKGYVYYDA